MKEYSLVLNPHHFEELLDALRAHQVTTDHAPGTSEQIKGICADLVRRAELLEAIVTAGDNLDEAQAAYNDYLIHGDDAPTAEPAKAEVRRISW